MKKWKYVIRKVLIYSFISGYSAHYYLNNGYIPRHIIFVVSMIILTNFFRLTYKLYEPGNIRIPRFIDRLLKLDFYKKRKEVFEGLRNSGKYISEKKAYFWFFWFYLIMLPITILEIVIMFLYKKIKREV